jgi:hypothetical protein
VLALEVSDLNYKVKAATLPRSLDSSKRNHHIGQNFHSAMKRCVPSRHYLTGIRLLDIRRRNPDLFEKAEETRDQQSHVA